jgi:hypothetical protein
LESPYYQHLEWGTLSRVHSKEIHKELLSFIFKNIIISAPNAIWEMQAMDFVSFSSYHSRSMEKFGIAISQLDPLVSRFLVPQQLLLG